MGTPKKLRAFCDATRREHSRVRGGARWHRPDDRRRHEPLQPGIGEGLLSACTGELQRLGVAAGRLSLATVPGALEIPLTLQTMARSGRFAALIALGAVIRGETYHFEIVANDSCRALMEVQLSTGVPIANGILTCEDDDQALARMHQKGIDCAQAAVEMANLLRAIGPGAIVMANSLRRHRVAGRRRSGRPADGAREFVLQGLYQWQVSGNDEAAIEAHLYDSEGFDKVDREFFVGLLRGVLAQRQDAGGTTAKLSRPTLWRTVADRSLRSARRRFRAEQLPADAVSGHHQRIDRAGQGFGGTDGHKYVNGVLDKLAARLRPAEVEAKRAARGRRR
jgi:6,7-dimethyl-8-ribityllumazine synthase